jgi:hypothetical protein
MLGVSLMRQSVVTCRVVISRGGLLLRIPTSLAQVSAVQLA